MENNKDLNTLSGDTTYTINGESKCPFHGGVLKQTSGSGTGNREYKIQPVLALEFDDLPALKNAAHPVSLEAPIGPEGESRLGDFLHAEPGTHHHELISPDGCVGSLTLANVAPA
jgi:hypothetical protein